MKISINLLSPEPEQEALKKKKKSLLVLSETFLVIFLVVNLIIFGFSWLMNKNTADTLTAIKQEEEKIKSLAETEKTYRNLADKLAFLSTIWQKKIKAEEALNFSQTLLVPQVSLTKVLLKSKGAMTLALTTDNSDGLEKFLDKLKEEEKSARIKEVKIVSTARNEKDGYDFNLTFFLMK